MLHLTYEGIIHRDLAANGNFGFELLEKEKVSFQYLISNG